MYIIERNKVVLEDLSETSSLLAIYNDDLLVNSNLLYNLDLIYASACIVNIYAAISAVKARLMLIDKQHRPDLTYEMVRDELDKPIYLGAVDTITSKFGIFVEHNKYKCDLSCGKFDYTIPITNTPSLTEQEKQELSFDFIPTIFLEFLQYLNTDRYNGDNPAIEGTKYYRYALNIHESIDFATIIPSTIEYNGYYARGDGGEGIFDRVALPADTKPDIGIIRRLKGLFYKRRYNDKVKAIWFGAGSNYVMTDEAFKSMLAYSNIEFNTDTVNISLSAPVEVEVDGIFNMVGHDTIINLHADTPLEYYVRFTSSKQSIVDITSFSFVVFNTQAPFRTVFEFDSNIVERNVLYKNKYNCEQLGNELLQTNRDYTLPSIHFSVLPELAASADANALATLGTISLDTDTSMYMTTSTAQQITGNHTYDSIDITGATSQNTAMPYTKLAGLKQSVMSSLEAKLKIFASSAKFKPPVNFVFIQYPNANGLLQSADEPSNKWQNTEWELLHKLPLAMILQANNVQTNELGYVLGNTSAGVGSLEVNIWRRIR